jgi:HEAT repeat protein
VRLQLASESPAILGLLDEDPSPLVRERAALAVGLLRPDGGETALLAACRRDDPVAVRAAAALAIGAFDQESIVARVVEMADEMPVRELIQLRLRDDAQYRLLSLKLRQSRSLELRALAADSRDAMETSLADGMRSVLDAGERVTLVHGLRAFQGERSRTALLQVVRGDPNPDVRAAALAAVGPQLDADELLLAARRALTDPSVPVRRAAVALFGRVAPDEALPHLLRGIRADDGPALLLAVAKQAEAAFDCFAGQVPGLAQHGREALGVLQVARHIHHPDLARLLAPAAASEAAEVRAALAALWIERPDLVEVAGLASLTEDPVVAVRRGAIRAAAASGRTMLIEDRIEDPEADVRRDVALVLGQVPGFVLPDALVHDPDPRVRAACAAAAILSGNAERLPEGVLRADAARAILDTAEPSDLRATARTAPIARHRLAAALALALLDDPTALEAARNDPVRGVRTAVHALLSPGVERP